MFGEKLSAFEWRWHLFWIIRNFAHSRLKENDKSLYGFASMSIRCAVPHRNDAKWKQKLVWRLLSFFKTRSLRFRSSTWPWSRFTLSQPCDNIGSKLFLLLPLARLATRKSDSILSCLIKNDWTNSSLQALKIHHQSFFISSITRVENNLKNRKRLQIHSTTKVKRLAHWKLESKGPTTAASTHEDLKRTHKRSCERSIKIALWIEERERQKSIVIIIIRWRRKPWHWNKTQENELLEKLFSLFSFSLIRYLLRNETKKKESSSLHERTNEPRTHNISTPEKFTLFLVQVQGPNGCVSKVFFFSYVSYRVLSSPPRRWCLGKSRLQCEIMTDHLLLAGRCACMWMCA